MIIIKKKPKKKLSNRIQSCEQTFFFFFFNKTTNYLIGLNATDCSACESERLFTKYTNRLPAECLRSEGILVLYLRSQLV